MPTGDRRLLFVCGGTFAVAVAALLTACTSKPGTESRPPLAVAYRLVDERDGSTGPSQQSVALIGNTTRYVLAAPTVLLLHGHDDAPQVTGSGELSY
jgi:hypothetical protein